MRPVLIAVMILLAIRLLTVPGWAGAADYCEGFAREQAFRKIGEAGTALGTTGVPSPQDERWRSAYETGLSGCLNSYRVKQSSAAVQPSSAEEPTEKAQPRKKAQIHSKRAPHKIASRPKKRMIVAKKNPVPPPAAEPAADRAETAKPAAERRKGTSFAPRTHTAPPAAQGA